MRRRIVIPDLRAGHCGWMTGRMPATGADVPYLGLALPRPLLGYEAVRHMGTPSSARPAETGRA